MRIRRVEIKNFRCLQDVKLDFDSVTTLLGPNGVGKSSILRALDWFFNGAKQKSLSVDDVYMGRADLPISVTVEFDSLTEADRDLLGSYVSDADELVVKKQWHDGAEKIIGRARVFEPFADIRAMTTAGEKKQAYNTLRSTDDSVELPAWTSQAAAHEAMDVWEAGHPGRLVEADVEAANHFFGFAGQATMSGLFDFIFVSADMRASEEAADTRSSIVGRILEQAIDRTSADEQFVDLYADINRRQEEIHHKNYSSELDQLSEALTRSVEQFSVGKRIMITAQLPELAPPKARFLTTITELEHGSTVDRQGHGFQRALMISALKLLADRGARSSNGVICLAIEEPELYQHPQQARTFSAVLRDLAEDAGQSVQVAYATHSPYFVDAQNFHQIRRVTKKASGGAPMVTVAQSDVNEIVSRLDGYVDADSVRRQLAGVCMGSFAEAFFAETALIVEGSTDRAILQGVAARESVDLLRKGIFVGEAGGKSSVLLPHAILTQLGIPAYVLVDNDSHLEEKLQFASDNGNTERAGKLTDAIADSVRWNRLVLQYFDEEQEDYPTGAYGGRLTFVDGGLEEAIRRDWPEWIEARDELVATGAGFGGKDRATYEQAARDAEGSAPQILLTVISDADSLRLAA